MSVQLNRVACAIAALFLVAVAGGCGEPSPEEIAAGQRIQEFLDECEMSCPLESCEGLCNCTIDAYRAKHGSDVNVIKFMDEVDATYQAGKIRESQEMVREFFEACRQHVDGA